MGHYKIEYDCGHTETICISGSSWYIKKRLDEMDRSLCKACRIDKKLREAAILEEELSLPELEGSAKQVEWARRLRYDEIKKAELEKDEARERAGSDLKRLEKYSDEVYNGFIDWLASHDSSFWWIDNFGGDVHYRKEDVTRLWREYISHPEDFVKPESKVQQKQTLESKKRSMIVLYPEDEKTKTVCYIISSGRDEDKKRRVLIHSTKDDVIIETLRSYTDVSWDAEEKVWYLSWSAKNIFSHKTYEDAYVGLASGLLKERIAVAVESEEFKEKVINDDYQKRQLYWIAVKDEKLAFVYRLFNEEKVSRLHAAVRGATYDKSNQCYWIDPKHYQAIRAWAEEDQVSITPEAEKVLLEAEEEYKNRLIVKPGSKKEKKIQEILASDTDILPDLLVE